MLKRKIYNSLVEWKNNKEKMCLVVKGARQVGKTYIVSSPIMKKKYIILNRLVL